MLSADFVVTLPFIITDAVPTEENTLPPSYWVHMSLCLAFSFGFDVLFV